MYILEARGCASRSPRFFFGHRPSRVHLLSVQMLIKCWHKFLLQGFPAGPLRALCTTPSPQGTENLILGLLWDPLVPLEPLRSDPGVPFGGSWGLL